MHDALTFHAESPALDRLIGRCERSPTTDDLNDLGQQLRDYTLVKHGLLTQETRRRLLDLYAGLPTGTRGCIGVMRGFITLALNARRECRRDDAVRLGEAALEVALSTNDPALRAVAYRINGILRAEAGQIVDALDCLATAARIEQSSEYQGLNQDPLAATVTMIAVLCYAGQYKTALSLIDKINAKAFHVGTELRPVSRVCLAINAAHIYLTLGEYRRGLESITEAVPFFEGAYACGGLECTSASYYYHARLLMETGQVAEAAQVVAHAQRVSSSRRWFDSTWLELLQGLLDIHEGRIETGLRTVNAAADEIVRVRPFTSLIDVSLVRARAYELSGQPSEARRGLLQALEHSSRLRRQQTRTILDDDGTLLTVARRARGTGADVRALRQRKLQNIAALAEYPVYPCARHIFRVGRLSELLAVESGISADSAHAIWLAGTLHDIGKIGMPRELLAKNTRLNSIEAESLRTHTTAGEQLLSDFDDTEYDAARQTAKHHHERWDGRGYPDRLAGEAIPIAARIVAIAEAFDAMTHDRPWVKRIALSDAILELHSQAGRQFDPALVGMFVRCVRRLCQAHVDVDAYLSQRADNTDLVAVQARINDAILGV